jgi:hypothetical protein
VLPGAEQDEDEDIEAGAEEDELDAGAGTELLPWLNGTSRGAARAPVTSSLPKSRESAVCGDAKVSGDESCDVALDALCAAGCRGRAQQLTSCTDSDACGQGRYCGTGTRYGLGSAGRVCTPIRCADGGSCGAADAPCGQCSADGIEDSASALSQSVPEALMSTGEESSSQMELMSSIFFGFDPALATRTPGALPGELRITNDGKANYTLPLREPIGIAGMQPNLSLRYNGSRFNGYLGAGWSLNGISSIARCPPTVGQNGVSAPIEDTANDRFCLDGLQLVAISGTYGGDGAEYRTEIDTFTKVISRGSPFSGSTYQGPVSFEVYRADGGIQIFGGTDATTELHGSVRRTWGIASARDRYGNDMVWSYDKQSCRQDPGGVYLCFNNGLRPTEVSYGSHASTGTGMRRWLATVGSASCTTTHAAIGVTPTSAAWRE